jgi:hypothetical protein
MPPLNVEGDTIRRQIISLLAEGPQGARELSQAVHQSEKEVYDHLAHIERRLCFRAPSATAAARPLSSLSKNPYQPPALPYWLT